MNRPSKEASGFEDGRDIHAADCSFNKLGFRSRPWVIQTAICRVEYDGSAEQTGGPRHVRIATTATKKRDGLT